jgi:hypothetical protein
MEDPFTIEIILGNLSLPDIYAVQRCSKFHSQQICAQPHVWKSLTQLRWPNNKCSDDWHKTYVELYKEEWLVKVVRESLTKRLSLEQVCYTVELSFAFFSLRLLGSVCSTGNNYIYAVVHYNNRESLNIFTFLLELYFYACYCHHPSQELRLETLSTILCIVTNLINSGFKVENNLTRDICARTEFHSKYGCKDTYQHVGNLVSLLVSKGVDLDVEFLKTHVQNTIPSERE